MKKIIFVAIAFLSEVIVYAQDKPETRMLDYDPDKLKIIPDKVFEFGIPMLLIFIVLNTIVNIIKNRADQQLKMKMVERGISEEALVKIFSESNKLIRLQPLKWFLFSLALGLALMLIHFSRPYLVNQSGYMAMGIVLVFCSVAFFIYYRVLTSWK